MNPRLFLVVLACAVPLSMRAAPADFNAVSGLGTRITGGEPTRPILLNNPFPGLDGPFYDPEDNEVWMRDIALASEVDEGNGFVQLGFTLTFTNTGPGYYEEMFIEWEPVSEEWQGVQVSDAVHTPVPDLVPHGTTSRPQPFLVRVPAAMRNAAVADVLAGKRLRPIGIELHRFTQPAVSVDEATDAALVSIAPSVLVAGASDATFSTNTPLLASLQPGTFLVESPHRYRAMDPRSGESALAELLRDILRQGADDEDPIVAPQVQEVLAVTPTNGTVVVTMRRREFLDVLAFGTISQRPQDALNQSRGGPPVRDIYRPPLGDNYLSYFEWPNQGLPPDFVTPTPPGGRSSFRGLHHQHDSLDYGARALHVPFNNFKIHQGITLDGELLLDALNVEVKVRFRGHGIIPKVTLKVGTKMEVTMRLRAQAGSNNRNRPLYDQEREFTAFRLPGLLFAIGPIPIEISPVLKGRVGAEIDAPTGVVIPLHGSLEAGCVMIWDNDRPPGQHYSYRPFNKSKPLTLSNPLLNDSLAFTAKAFAEAGLAIEVNRFAGPYFGARVTADFELNPTNSPWWSLDLTLHPVAEFRLSILGFHPFHIGGLIGNGIPLGRKEAIGPVPGGSGGPGGTPPAPFDPVSGGETRWVRKAGTFPGAMKVVRVPGTDEDVFTITETTSFRPPITRIGAKGDVLWAKGAPVFQPLRLAGTPDGGCVFVTGGFISTVVWMDGDGQAIAARTFQPRDGDGNPQLFYVGAIVVNPAGETFVAGSISRAAFDVDPFLIKYDASHNFVFGKRFQTPVTQEFITDAALAPNGDIVLCGHAEGPADSGQFAQPEFAAPGLIGGLLMRMDDSGDMIWGARPIPGMNFNSVTVSPDGRIYTAGRFHRTVAVAWPALLVCRHDPGTGEPDLLVAYGETVSGANPVLPGINGDVIPGAGFTLFDEATSIEWTSNGLIVGGNTAALPDTTTRAPLVLRLSEQFSLRWFSTHQAAGADDGLFDLVPTAQGIFTAGFSRGLGPSDVNNDPAPAVLMKLPFEGRVDFENPHLAGNFVVPAIKSVPDYGPVYPGQPSAPHGYAGTEILTFTEVMHTFATADVPPPAFTDVDIDYSAPLQKSTIDTPLLSIERAGANAALSWHRRFSNFVVEATSDLRGPATDWMTLTNAPVSVDGGLRVTVPGTEPRKFFRLKEATP